MSLFELFCDSNGRDDIDGGEIRCVENYSVEELIIEESRKMDTKCEVILSTEFVDGWRYDGRYDDGYSNQDETTSDETKLNEEINLMDFDKGVFDEFVESDLIDFGCVEGELVRCSNVKDEMIEKANGETLGQPRRIGDVDGMEEMVKDLLRALRDKDFDESDCGVDLPKWHRHSYFEGLDSGNKDRGDSIMKNEDEVEVTKEVFANDCDGSAAGHADGINDVVVDSVVENGIFGWYWDPVEDGDSNGVTNLESNGREIRRVYNHGKKLLMKGNGNSGFGDVVDVYGEIMCKELETSGRSSWGSSLCHSGEQYATYLPEK
ncbi:hypothetical protein C2G38_2153186 [Gigaspora rosea]|uniref:Uncharacterized protein n=1 Tax=Gigaspora rosea TaxID=44941 RepID=A0A397WD81_9GLOM|nr:hypothetical protein C2G38_2153186 [Gigaspora rosea]